MQCPALNMEKCAGYASMELPLPSSLIILITPTLLYYHIIIVITNMTRAIQTTRRSVSTPSLMKKNRGPQIDRETNHLKKLSYGLAASISIPTRQLRKSIQEMIKVGYGCLSLGEGMKQHLLSPENIHKTGNTEYITFSRSANEVLYDGIVKLAAGVLNDLSDYHEFDESLESLLDRNNCQLMVMTIHQSERPHPSFIEDDGIFLLK